MDLTLAQYDRIRRISGNEVMEAWIPSGFGATPRERWRAARWRKRYTKRYGKPPLKGEVGSLWGIRVEPQD